MTSYCSENQNGLIIETALVFGRLKKKSQRIFIIVGWLCPHTAKINLYEIPM